MSRAVWLLLRVRYTYLGVGLDAFVCGRTALVDGIHCRGLGAQFFESWLPDEHTFWRKAAPFIKTFDEQAAFNSQYRAVAISSDLLLHLVWWCPTGTRPAALCQAWA